MIKYLYQLYHIFLNIFFLTLCFEIKSTPTNQDSSSYSTNSHPDTLPSNFWHQYHTILENQKLFCWFLCDWSSYDRYCEYKKAEIENTRREAEYNQAVTKICNIFVFDPYLSMNTKGTTPIFENKYNDKDQKDFNDWVTNITNAPPSLKFDFLKKKQRKHLDWIQDTIIKLEQHYSNNTKREEDCAPENVTTSLQKTGDDLLAPIPEWGDDRPAPIPEWGDDRPAPIPDWYVTHMKALYHKYEMGELLDTSLFFYRAIRGEFTHVPLALESISKQNTQLNAEYIPQGLEQLFDWDGPLSVKNPPSKFLKALLIWRQLFRLVWDITQDGDIDECNIQMRCLYECPKLEEALRQAMSPTTSLNLSEPSRPTICQRRSSHRLIGKIRSQKYRRKLRKIKRRLNKRSPRKRIRLQSKPAKKCCGKTKQSQK